MIHIKTLAAMVSPFSPFFVNFVCAKFDII